MESWQKGRTEKVLEHCAAEFLSRESNRLSLITVTGSKTTEDLGKITFLVSVYPEDREAEALGFLKRQRPELRTYIKEAVQLRRIPHIDFEIDIGEKNRRGVEGASS